MQLIDSFSVVILLSRKIPDTNMNCLIVGGFI